MELNDTKLELQDNVGNIYFITDFEDGLRLKDAGSDYFHFYNDSGESVIDTQPKGIFIGGGDNNLAALDSIGLDLRADGFGDRIVSDPISDSQHFLTSDVYSIQVLQWGWDNATSSPELNLQNKTGTVVHFRADGSNINTDLTVGDGINMTMSGAMTISSIKLTADSFDCASNTEGELFYNSTDKHAYLCNSTDLRQLDNII